MVADNRIANMVALQRIFNSMEKPLLHKIILYYYFHVRIAVFVTHILLLTDQKLKRANFYVESFHFDGIQ